MAFGLSVGATSLTGITVAGGRVVLQEWPGIHAATIEAALPQLVAASWPNLGSVAVPRQFSAGLLLDAVSPPAFASLWDAVAAVVQTTGTVTLTRTRDLLAGVQTRTARAVYLGGLEPTMRSHAAGVCVPKWQLLEEWHA